MYYKTIRALPSSAAHHPPLTTIHRPTRYLDTPPHELPSTSWEGTLPPSTTACTGLPIRTPALNRPDDLAHRPPAELLTELVDTEREILAWLEELQAEFAGEA